MTVTKNRFVLLCQQALACAVVVLLAAPATGIGSLDLVAPPAGEEAGHQPEPAVGALVAAAPVEATVTRVPLTADPATAPRSPEALTTAAAPLRIVEIAGDPSPSDGAVTPDEAVRSTAQPVEGYATVGVTWATGQKLEDDEIAVSVRSLDDGAWSEWEDLPYDAEHGPDPGSVEADAQRFGTDALVVGNVDDVQVKAVTSEETLPDGMSLDIVDPGDSTALTREQPAIDTADLAPADYAPRSPTEPSDLGDVELAGTPADVTPEPEIFSRAQWGADEGMRDKESLKYFEVHAGFVHHTVNANNYTREQVPSILRGIYAYHTQSRGWSDVGYNFLVDRFGRTWEGRYGGVARPVVGAHTLGYNEEAFAMSAIGNFETVKPSAAMLDAYGKLMAWKLSLHGIDAGARSQRVGSSTFPAVNGHRDADQTACPGRYLYAELDTIRTKAIGYQRPFSGRQKDTDISGNRWPDLVVRDRATKAVSVVRTGGQVGFQSPIVAAKGWGGVDLHVTSRDLTGDGLADIVARNARTKKSTLRPGTGSGTFGPAVATTGRFKAMDQLAAVGDFDGDGHNDLVGRNATSMRLVLVRGTGTGKFEKSRTLAEGWSTYDLTAAAGDLDGDGNPDLLARDTDNKLWLVPGTGKGAVRDRVALGGSWGGFGSVAGLGDVTNDGEPDIVARSRKTGSAWFYPGDGQGGIGKRLGPFDKFSGVDFLSSPGQVTGSKKADLVGRNDAGRLVVFVNKGTKNLGRTVPTGATFTDTDLILSVGDWNGDGRNDVMTRGSSDGAMLFRAGLTGNGFAEPVVAGTGWSAVTLLTAVGDLTGDGYPDVMGQPSGGAMRVYPSNGSSGFSASFVARSGLTSTQQVGAGLWTGDGAPDSIIRRSDGTLWVYRGNGPGGLTGGGVKVGSQAGRYDWMVGAGDVDGNGRPDVIARQQATSDLWLLPGENGGRLGTRRLIGKGFGDYDLVG